MTRRCSVMRMPVAAQRASIPVFLSADEDFSAVMYLALEAAIEGDGGLFCHRAHITTSRAASEAHSIAPRRAAGNSARGGQRRQIRPVHTAVAPAGYSPRPPEIS